MVRNNNTARDSIQPQGTGGLIFREKELREKSNPGRSAFSIPAGDVPVEVMDPDLIRESADLPELSELEIVRHYTRLSQWNFGVDSGMYPLGSCTMKYNPKINEEQAARREFTSAHPLAGAAVTQGALQLMYELEQQLAAITGFPAHTLQPAAGAHGEFTGMLILRAWHRSQGKQRSRVIVPDTAHGTNPASVALCGFETVTIKSGQDGILNPEEVAAVMDEETAGIMVTNPNTLGLFERNIRKIADIVHERGGLVYGDGANMNAIMGIVKPAELGIDIMHLNLHKTFSTPHGGGGPGAGPVCVTEALSPFLPVPVVVKNEDSKYAFCYDRPDSIGRLHTFYGHFAVMIRAYAYILSMGAEGLKKVSQYAVLNANYLKESLKGILNLPYDHRCMHECVFNDKNQKSRGVTTMDIAKRLLDYGFHPPTVYFPLVVDSAFMIEPTETESKENLDMFVEAVRAIDRESLEDPAVIHNAPVLAKVRRLDEVQAARKPQLRG